MADFGASKRVSNKSMMLSTGIKGTPQWMAPEVIKEQQTDRGWKKADIWSVGCTVIEMATVRYDSNLSFSNPCLLFSRSSLSRSLSLSLSLSLSSLSLPPPLFSRSSLSLSLSLSSSVSPSSLRESHRGQNSRIRLPVCFTSPLKEAYRRFRKISRPMAETS